MVRLRRAAIAAAVLAAAALAAGAGASGESLADLGGAAKEIESAPGVKNLGPWAKGLLKGMPAGAAGPAAMAPDAKYPLVLAEDRTRRPDVLDHLRMYEGGWNVTNKHYWASVSFTGVSGFLLAAMLFIFLGIAAAGRCYFGSRMGKGNVSPVDAVRPVLLVVFVLTFIAGCIVLLCGQSKFHEEATRTMDFVVNQSDFTIQTLRNVTEYLSFAKTITVAALYLPSDVQNQIDSLKGDLNKAADTISQKTTENYKRIRKVLHTIFRIIWTEIYSLHNCYLMLDSHGSSLYSSRSFPDTKQCCQGYLRGNGPMGPASSSRDSSQQHPTMCG